MAADSMHEWLERVRLRVGSESPDIALSGEWGAVCMKWRQSGQDAVDAVMMFFLCHLSWAP
jgi:hypothetical protein